MNRPGQPAQNRSHGFSNMLSSMNNRQSPVPLWGAAGGFNKPLQSQPTPTTPTRRPQTGSVLNSNHFPSLSAVSQSGNTLQQQQQQFSTGALDMNEFPTLSQATSKSYSSVMGSGIPGNGVAGGSANASGQFGNALFSRSGTQSPMPMGGVRGAPPGLMNQQQQKLDTAHQQVLLQQQQLQLQQQRPQQQQQQQQQQSSLLGTIGEQEDKVWTEGSMPNALNANTGQIPYAQMAIGSEASNGVANHPIIDGFEDKLQLDENDFSSMGGRPASDIWSQAIRQNSADEKENGNSSSKISSDLPFGLNELSNFMKSEQSNDIGRLALGTDLTALGLNFNQPDSEPLCTSFGSPWAETSNVRVEPEYHLPTCYHVQSVEPQVDKIQKFSDETLFYIFYSMPRDYMQDIAANELINRNWRYHKDLKMWLTKDPGVEPIAQNMHYERGVYTFFDTTVWDKVKKEYILYYQSIADH
ncbi:uncharacterized protein V1516DRAFT_644957 [Lipomyces oligophaga]|uniref:uncharacterized protein n=1 Tax=Lipomyces oligophaga TaxID=45792 RepID=UPI0034CE7B30